MNCPDLQFIDIKRIWTCNFRENYNSLQLFEIGFVFTPSFFITINCKNSTAVSVKANYLWVRDFESRLKTSLVGEVGRTKSEIGDWNYFLDYFDILKFNLILQI